MNQNQPFSVPPIAIRLLIVLAVIQLVREVLTSDTDAYLMFYLGFSLFRDGFFDPVWIYGAVTSVLMHGGWWHLASNAMWLVVVSPQIVPHMNNQRFVAFFMVTGTAGAVFHALVNWGEPAFLVGASGAVFGLLGAGAYVLVKGQDGISRPTGRDIAQYVLLMMIVNVGYAMMSGGVVSWEAHAGGFFAGLSLFPLMRQRPENPD